MREIRVETYLYEGITDLDGLCVKIPPTMGRVNQPDRLILLRFITPHTVETKKPGKDATEGQKREHVRYRDRNMPVFVLDTIAKVDRHLKILRFLHDTAEGHIFSARELERICASTLH